MKPPRRPPIAATVGGRPKEATPTSMQPPKVVPKGLISAFSAVPEEILTQANNLLDFSTGASNTVEDPQECPIWKSTPAELRSQGFTEIGVKKGEEEAAAAEEEEEEEEEKVGTEVAHCLRKALLEVSKSTDVSNGSKKLLGILLELVIADMGADLCEENGRLDSLFYAKARIWIVCFLLLMVALMNFFALSVMFFGRGGGDLYGLPPPT